MDDLLVGQLVRSWRARLGRRLQRLLGQQRPSRHAELRLRGRLRLQPRLGRPGQRHELRQVLEGRRRQVHHLRPDLHRHCVHSRRPVGADSPRHRHGGHDGHGLRHARGGQRVQPAHRLGLPGSLLRGPGRRPHARRRHDRRELLRLPARRVRRRAQDPRVGQRDLRRRPRDLA